METTLLRIKQHHEELIEGFKKVGKTSLQSQEGKDLFVHVKTKFMTHLNFEDKMFYPVLNKAAEADKELQNTLKIFAKEMQEIAESIMVFFEQDDLNSGGSRFIRAFEKNFSLLRQRILREENILFPKYKKVQAKKAKLAA
jgi:iron-sulfur cluster repair protein YtfE (RIC family)